MSKHTEGPWKWDGSVRVDAGQIEEGKTTSNLVALIYERRIGETGDLASNARLIAAAPDLLEALQECADYFDQRADAEYFPDSAQPVANEEMTLLCMVRDVLKKAGVR